MLEFAAPAITAASAIVVGWFGLSINRQRARDAKQASLIDDLSEQVARKREDLLDAEALLRATMDYVLTLRSALSAADAEIPPWPENLSRR